MRRTALFVILGVALVGAALIVLRLRSRHSVAAANALNPATTKPAAVPFRPPTQPVPQPVPTDAEIDPNDPVAFASLADAGASELREGISLEQWKASQNKLDDWRPSKSESFFDCRTFVKTVSLRSGRQIRHLVYFYPPKVPTPVAFPTASGDDLMNHDCKLSMVRVVISASTDRDGHAFERAVQQHFVPKYGQSTEMKGTLYEHYDGAHWLAASEILSAYDPQPQRSQDDSDEPDGGEVFVSARLPLVHAIEQESCCRITDHYHSIEESQFHQALGIAAVNPGLSDRVATLFSRVFRRIEPEPEPEDLEQARTTVLPLLREWLNAIKSLPAARQAAGLYVADRLLVAASDNGWQDLITKEKTDLRVALEKLGADFQYDELGGCYGYSGSWLDRARELDPEGTVGQMALLVSLERGGAPILPKDKDAKLDIFHTVISDGEWLLSKNPDVATAAQIHFIIGDANASIVALAGGSEPDYGDPTEYQPEAPFARHNALEHYRAGLAIDGTSDNAKYAWLQAWKLSAGLLPQTRWVYIYD